MTQAYIVTEQPSDAAILKKSLPKTILQSVKFVAGESQYGAESMASTLLASRRLPVVLVVNARMNDELMIREQAEELGYLLRQAAAGVPFKLAIAVPEIEVVFFQDRLTLEALIHKTLTDLEWQFAQRHPKELLDTLPEGSYSFIETTLSVLDEDGIRMLCQHPLIQEVTEFLSNLILTPK